VSQGNHRDTSGIATAKRLSMGGLKLLDAPLLITKEFVTLTSLHSLTPCLKTTGM